MLHVYATVHAQDRTQGIVQLAMHTALITGCRQNPPGQHHHAKQKQDFRYRLGPTARQSTYEATGCSASTQASSPSLPKQPLLRHQQYAPSILHTCIYPNHLNTTPAPTPWHTQTHLSAAFSCTRLPPAAASYLCSSLQRRRAKVLHQQLLQLGQQVVLMAWHACLNLSRQLRVLANLPTQEDLHTLNSLAI